MAPCYRNIARKPLELLENPKVYMPIHIGDESRKQVIEWPM